MPRVFFKGIALPRRSAVFSRTLGGRRRLRGGEMIAGFIECT